MDKSMRRANKRLAEAKEFADWILNKPKPKPAPVAKTAPVVKPVWIAPKPRLVKVIRAKIKKVGKGCFKVEVLCGGKIHEIEKRFKSTTKAQEWISTHEYIELPNIPIVNKLDSATTIAPLF